MPRNGKPFDRYGQQGGQPQPHERQNAAFARCHLAAQVGSVPAGEYLPDCVRAAGYSDWCAVKTPGTIGVIPDCYRGSSLLTRWRDAIR